MNATLLAGGGHLAEFLRERLSESLRGEIVTAGAEDSPPRSEVVIVHLASLGECDAPPVGQAAIEIVTRAVQSAARRLVVVSSALVHPPQPSHPGLVEQRSPAISGEAPVSRAWREVERLVEREAQEAGLELVILRPAITLVAGDESFLAKLLSGKTATVFLGHDPGLQFLDPEDLTLAIALLAEAPEASGIFHAGPASVIPLSRALELAGVRARRALRLPPSSRGKPSVEADLRERLRYEWTVGSERLRAVTGYQPQHTSASAILRFCKKDEAGGRGTRPFDAYGHDPHEVARLDRGLLGFLHDRWWRVQAAGTEHIPASGPAMMVGIHRGFMPFDGAMTILDVLRNTGRDLRLLIHPSLVKFPFLAPFHTQLGGVIATVTNAERLLDAGDLLGIYPEGIDGAFTEYRDAYRKLAPFGRDQFARVAISKQVPILPFVTVGPVEAYPVLLGIDWGWWKRTTGWPSFPITATWPLVPIPLPTRWFTQVLAPIDVAALYPAEAARDAEAVRELSRHVQDVLVCGWAELRRRRGARIFAGDLAPPLS